MARFKIGARSGLVDVVFSAEQPARAASVSNSERLLFAADGRCIGYSAPGVIEVELPDVDDWAHAQQLLAEDKPVRREVEIMLAVGSREVPAGICQAAFAETEAPKRGAPPKHTADRDHAIWLLYRHLLSEYRAGEEKAPRERTLSEIRRSFPELKRKTVERILATKST